MKVSNADYNDVMERRTVPTFAIMCSLAILGIFYSLAILVFNALKHKDKVIKITSPNINIVILIGSCLSYSCIIIIGLDSSLVSFANMASLVQASSFLLCFSFSLIYGSVFSKVWRVFMIFKNVNLNGKNTRDEHLLLVVFVLLLVDLGVLVPWISTDAIKCYPTIYISNSSVSSSATIRVDTCHSSLQSLWIALIYIIKGSLLLVGLFFTWQTRRVTLPSLKDTVQIFVMIFTVVSMAVVCLPILLSDDVNMSTRFATGSIAIWIANTTTITLLFIPKILLWHRGRVRDGPDTFRFQFSESMKKTREAVKNCSLCFCCDSESGEEKYATEVLTNEIETLKKTIKEKDSTIRELTDRLFLGAEKFQQYLTSPKRQNPSFSRKTIATRTYSQPYGTNNDHVITEHSRRPQHRQLQRAYTETRKLDVYNHEMVFDNNVLMNSGRSSPPYAVSVVDAGHQYYPVSQEYPHHHDGQRRGTLVLTTPRGNSHSSNHDSAIENTTLCSSESSGSDVQRTTNSRDFRPPLLRALTEPVSSMTPTVALSHINIQEGGEPPVHYSSKRYGPSQNQMGLEKGEYPGCSFERAAIPRI